MRRFMGIPFSEDKLGLHQPDFSLKQSKEKQQWLFLLVLGAGN
jgi:hypothetical protein